MEMADKPLVSVVIPCYNNFSEIFLRECFNSIIHQTYPNIQLIIIDDGSVDEASALLEKLKTEYHFILEKQINKGISGALNTGITKYAKGKYVSILGSDDFWELNKIEKQVAFMENANPGIVACCTQGYYVFDNDPSRPTPRLTRLLKEKEFSFDGLILGNNILQISVMIKKEIFDEIGLFDEKSTMEDWDMWLRIADKYLWAYIPEPLVYYRRHSNNLSNYFTVKWYNSLKYTINKWRDRKGYAASMNTIAISGINNFARYQKLKAFEIAAKNIQCAGKWLYWRGVFKIFAPGFIYLKKGNKN